MQIIRTILATGVMLSCATSFAEDIPPGLPPGAKKLALKSPRPHVPTEARVKHLKGAGVFVVRVRPDGSVSGVDIERSTGHAVLDRASIDAFSQWRFVAGSLTKCRIPVTYTGVYPKE